VHSPKPPAQALLLDELPWSLSLPPSDRAAFIDEVARTVVATAEPDDLGPVAQTVREWQATARIHADPDLAHRLIKPISTNGESVHRPTI